MLYCNNENTFPIYVYTLELTTRNNNKKKEKEIDVLRDLKMYGSLISRS